MELLFHWWRRRDGSKKLTSSDLTCLMVSDCSSIGWPRLSTVLLSSSGCDMIYKVPREIRNFFALFWTCFLSKSTRLFEERLCVYAAQSSTIILTWAKELDIVAHIHWQYQRSFPLVFYFQKLKESCQMLRWYSSSLSWFWQMVFGIAGEVSTTSLFVTAQHSSKSLIKWKRWKTRKNFSFEPAFFDALMMVVYTPWNFLGIVIMTSESSKMDSFPCEVVRRFCSSTNSKSVGTLLTFIGCGNFPTNPTQR